MAPPKIKATQIKDVKHLKALLKKKGGGGFMSRIPAEGSITVRFLGEPNSWVQFQEHYNDTDKYFPCVEGNCKGCNAGDDSSKRYVANVVDVLENKSVVLVMQSTAASSVVKKYEKYGTLLDRDYELSKSGTGYDTEFDVNPEPPTKMALDRYDTQDLWEVLSAQVPGADPSGDEDDDEDEDEPRRPVRRSTSSTARRAIKKPTRVQDEDDEEDEAPAPRKVLKKRIVRRPS